MFFNHSSAGHLNMISCLRRSESKLEIVVPEKQLNHADEDPASGGDAANSPISFGKYIHPTK